MTCRVKSPQRRFDSFYPIRTTFDLRCLFFEEGDATSGGCTSDEAAADDDGGTWITNGVLNDVGFDVNIVFWFDDDNIEVLDDDNVLFMVCIAKESFSAVYISGGTIVRLLS